MDNLLIFLMMTCHSSKREEGKTWLNNVEADTDLLRRFISERGKILPRRVTGTSAKNQRKLTVAIKRARIMGLLPFVAED